MKSEVKHVVAVCSTKIRYYYERGPWGSEVDPALGRGRGDLSLTNCSIRFRSIMGTYLKLFYNGHYCWRWLRRRCVGLVLVLGLVSIHRNFNCVLEAERDTVARVSLSPSSGDHHTWYSPLLSGGGRIICLISKWGLRCVQTGRAWINESDNCCKCELF